MIVRSRLVFACVMVGSSALHLAAMSLIWSEPVAQMEGGAQVAESSLGSSFADVSQGVQRPLQVVQEVAQSVQPMPARRIMAQAAQSPVSPTERNDRSAVAVISPSRQTVLTSEVTMSTEAQTPIVQPNQSYIPAKSETQASTPETIVAALPEASGATPVSTRPRMPVKRPEPPKAEAAPKRAARLPKPSKARGNANRNAKAGTQNGNSANPAQPRQASKANTRKAQGNAAASNYPGQVMRRISRVPRPRTSARGVAVIQFSIAANGGLTSAKVARSSGSATLDSAALAVVRKAQPFPRPPPGARLSYSIKIKGQ